MRVKIRSSRHWQRTLTKPTILPSHHIQIAAQTAASDWVAEEAAVAAGVGTEMAYGLNALATRAEGDPRPRPNILCTRRSNG